MRKIFAIPAVLVLLASGIVAIADHRDLEQTAEDFHFRIFIEDDRNAAEELLIGEDFVWHGGAARVLCPPDGPCAGIPPVQAFADVLNGGLSNLGVVHDEVFAHGQLVEIRWTASGVHTGELLGFPPTGCDIIFTGNDLFRLEEGENGRLAELWQETDLLHLIGQLQQDSCVPLGNPVYCRLSVNGPCGVGEGDCDSDAECQSGLACVHDVGANYGFGPAVDVCEAP